jgi:hypothetical protein
MLRSSAFGAGASEAAASAMEALSSLKFFNSV